MRPEADANRHEQARARPNDLLTLSAAARELPRRRRGAPTSPSTVYRWITKGIAGVKLEAFQVGTALCVTREGLMRFFRTVADRRLAEPEAGESVSTPARRTSRTRGTATQKAATARVLARAGLTSHADNKRS